MKFWYYKYKRNQTKIFINSVCILIPLIVRYHIAFKIFLFDYFFKNKRNYFLFKNLRNSFSRLLQNNLSKSLQGYKVRLLLIDKNKDGYKILDKNSELSFKLGKSHDISFKIQDGLKYKLGRKAKSITMRSLDYKFLLSIVLRLRNERLPEPYKGKGVLFKHEVIKKKKIRKLRTVKNFKKKRRK